MYQKVRGCASVQLFPIQPGCRVVVGVIGAVADPTGLAGHDEDAALVHVLVTLRPVGVGAADKVPAGSSGEFF